MKICEYSSCDRASVALNYCEKHYTRLRKYGSPDSIFPTGKRPTPMPHKTRGSIIEIELSNSPDKLIISKEDIELTKYRWHLDCDGYAATKSRGRSRRIHKYIIGYPEKGFVADHINRVRLDNRRENLRIVTWRENCLNRVNVKNTSGYTGVRWHKRAKKYIANIRVNGKLIHLGYYNELQDAVNARKSAEPEEYKLVCNIRTEV